MPIDFVTKQVRSFRNLPFGEPDLVRLFFRHKSDGFYVDIGANHPTEDSQSWHLEQLGWRGLLVEPLPHYCDMLKTERTGQVIQLACSSPQNHGKTLQLLVAGVHSTLNAAPIALGAQAHETILVETRTLDSILESHQVPADFDLLSIDVEGHEMQVFEGLDLSRWRPKLILMEDHVIGLSKHRFLTRHGYQILMRTGLNAWYVPASEGYQLSWLAKLGYIRKYWLGLWLRQMKYRR